MELIEVLKFQKNRQDAGNPILSEEIYNNRYFDCFIFDMIFDSGSCISNLKTCF